MEKELEDGIYSPVTEISCKECIKNAENDDEGTCRCSDDFKGLKCDEKCHPVCASCSGPNKEDCIACVP